MGWSFTAKAGKVLNAWEDACRSLTGTSNTFTCPEGKFFFEALTEESGGAIVGDIFKMDDDGGARHADTFRIEADGTVTRAPAFLKAVEVKPYRAPRYTFTLV